MSHMWADTLMAAERAHSMSLLTWSAISMLMGTGLIAWLRSGERASHLVQHFAIQLMCWGAVEASSALAGLMCLSVRDLSAATRLDRFLWMNIGLDGGYVILGTALLVVGWRLGRRLGLVGAGIGVLVQGAALAVLNLSLAVQISR